MEETKIQMIQSSLHPPWIDKPRKISATDFILPLSAIDKPHCLKFQLESGNSFFLYRADDRIQIRYSIGAGTMPEG